MDNILISPILDTDSYKLSHWPQYPPNTTGMYSYLESRGGKGDKTLFFCLQYNMKKYLSTPITMEMVEEANAFSLLHGEPFNYEGWKYIVNELGGKLPVRIKAVPEGMIIPKSNVLLTVESTDSKCFWVTSWLETMLVRLWYPITVATNSHNIKDVIEFYMEKTADYTETDLMFKLQDFGSRGASSQESAGIGGMAHLVNFLGSDTIAGIYYANKYYGSEMAGYSIPASEHSTMTMWGQDREIDAYRNMIKQYGNGNIFACVSDSYDVYNATEKMWGDELKAEVLNMNATLVVRPDSGDPVKVPVELVQILDTKYGHTINSKGYKVLNKVSVIQGDGIDINEVEEILNSLEQLGYAASNMTFGMGGGLLQKNMDRDTHRFAFKCSWALVDGKSVDVQKKPVTDTGKLSKKGKLKLAYIFDCNSVDKENVMKVKTVAEDEGYSNDLLELVYENGVILKEYTFEEVRNNTKIVIEKWVNYGQDSI